MGMRFIACVVALTAATAVVPSGFAASGGNKAQRARLELAARELQRRVKLADWARTAKPSPTERFMATMRPIIEGNRKDIERNLELATTYRDKATDAQQRLEEGKAEAYAKAARLFYGSAQVNKQILTALKTRDSETLNEGFTALSKIEDEIFTLTKKRIEREWFTPDELTMYKRMLRAQQQAEEGEDE